LPYVYAAICTIVAALVIGATIVAVRRLDRTTRDSVSVPWWLTWRRTVLLAAIAVACGAIGRLAGNPSAGAAALFIITYILLPVLYNFIGIRVGAYRLEQGLLWPLWLLGTSIDNGVDRLAVWLALLCFGGSFTFGAVIAKLGVRSAWTWKAIWRRQAPTD
jgi:hypothetical protein